MVDKVDNFLILLLAEVLFLGKPQTVGFATNVNTRIPENDRQHN